MSAADNDTVLSVKKFRRLRTTHIMRRHIKIFVEYSQCVTELLNFDRVIPEDCLCFVNVHDLGRGLSRDSPPTLQATS
ncbi:hypothetical protein E2C01_099492 [Portunus trituberculatus]|uniref:Uncharacterized protein n=1 Tax=Portunus trituberculatus TaxID=210409 RepID=A0A5B7KB42_PORTR|nr:hypothetical protein [Portunus trituberculatus]